MKAVAAYLVAAIVPNFAFMYLTATGPVFMPLLGSPRLDCIGIEEWRCEEAIHEYDGRGDRPVVYFKFEAKPPWPDCDSIEDPDDRDHCGHCRDYTITFLVDTFGPFGWFGATEQQSAQPLCSN